MVQEKKNSHSEKQKILTEHLNQHNKFAQGAEKDRLFVKMKTSTETVALCNEGDTTSTKIWITQPEWNNSTINIPILT